MAFKHPPTPCSASVTCFEINGIAARANNFFIVNLEQVGMYNLPAKFLTPILLWPRYLNSDEVLADVNGAPLLERRLFLIDCNLPEEQVARHYPTLWRYLQLGVEQGVHNGYLCRHRKPWYAQDMRAPSLFLCTYMGRPANDHAGSPFRFILNHSLAVAPECLPEHLPQLAATRPVWQKNRNGNVLSGISASSCCRSIGRGRARLRRWIVQARTKRVRQSTYY